MTTFERRHASNLSSDWGTRMAISVLPHDKEIVTRKQAKLSGERRYFTGKTCIHGHISERYTATKVCVACGYMHARRAYMKDKKSYVARMTKWNKQHPEIASARVALWVKNNPERSKAIKKKWATNNPEKTRAVVANRRARRLGAVGKHTDKDIALLLKSQRGRCANSSCGIELGTNYHRDHIMPLVLGGGNDMKNIQLLCPPCNRGKWTKHPIDWARENGLLL